MAYNLTKLISESDYKQLYLTYYCDPNKPIKTFDGITVKFFPDKFEHAFYESNDRQLGDKGKFSLIRAERILWIKDTLEDPSADLRVGWDKKFKTYDKSRRVAVVKNNYVVVIWVRNNSEAKFVTAYEADNSINKILASPKWTGL